MTDNRDRIRAASDLLWENWQAGTRFACLPDEIRPRTRAEGYAVQAVLERRSGAPLFGWKVAATSKAGQNHIGVDGPLAGRLLSENVSESGAELPLKANQMRVAEPEFAFRMARDLVPGQSVTLSRRSRTRSIRCTRPLSCPTPGITTLPASARRS